MARIVNLDDFRISARRRLPRIAYDFIESGTDDEIGLTTNTQAFRDSRIVPRYLVGSIDRDLSAIVFGRTYSSPVGIAPTGMAALFRRGADMMLASAAREANVPFILSGTGTASIEDLARTAPEHGWYQFFSTRDQSIAEDKIRRAADAGLKTIVLTVDVPEASKRERNIRNGWGRPLKLTWSTRLEALKHPAWLLEWIRHGTPLFSNWARYCGPDANVDKVADFVARQTRGPVSWEQAARYRDLWPGHFVVKGIMHPEDAVKAKSLGFDGIIVSNHGARQLDLAPAPLHILPAIRKAVGGSMTLMLDGGVRRGADAVVALCTGANYVFVGRPTLYAVAANGEAGVAKALQIIRHEVDVTMGQIGATTLADLGPHYLGQQRS